MFEVPQYVADRIRCPFPEDCHVVPGSTPVVSFGNLATARVATLGLNPSKSEFLDKHGELLVGPDRRLATHQSLGVRGLENGTDAHIAQVLSDCYEYFKQNPYKKWFDHMEGLMSASVGASYHDGTACHLDLVQWATDPVWGQLPGPVKKKLITADREFLRRQLQQEQIRLVLLNGVGAVNAVKKMGVTLTTTARALAGGAWSDVFVGEDYGATFIGWSKNIPSSRGLTNALKQAIFDRVKQEAATAGFELHPAKAPNVDSGFLERGTTATSKPELLTLLQAWAVSSNAPTIGDIGTYGGKAWVFVTDGPNDFALNADTTRQAILDLLAHTNANPGHPWHVVANKNGKVNRVVYRSDTPKLPGWYCYTGKPWLTPGQI